MLELTQIKADREVEAIMEMSARSIEALGYTEHSRRHSSIVSKWSGEILRALGKSEERVRLAEIAGYLHDIGNCINRDHHSQSGAILAYQIVTRLGKPRRTVRDPRLRRFGGAHPCRQGGRSQEPREEEH